MTIYDNKIHVVIANKKCDIGTRHYQLMYVPVQFQLIENDSLMVKIT